jgi:hypothetical protein
MQMKICGDCKENKKLGRFYDNNGARSGPLRKQSKCIDCASKSNKI